MMKLKECPFCGGQSASINRMFYAFCVVCKNCQMTFIPFDATSEGDVVKAWNARRNKDCNNKEDNK